MEMLDDKRIKNINSLKEKYSDGVVDELITKYNLDRDKNIFLSHGKYLSETFNDCSQFEQFVEYYINEHSDKVLSFVPFSRYVTNYVNREINNKKRQKIEIYENEEENIDKNVGNEEIKFIKSYVEDALGEIVDIKEGVRILITEQGDAEEKMISLDLLKELNKTSNDTNQLLRKQLDTKTAKKATEEQVKQLESKITKSLNEIKKNTKTDLVNSLDNKTFIRIVLGSMGAFFLFMMIAILFLKLL